MLGELILRLIRKYHVAVLGVVLVVSLFAAAVIFKNGLPKSYELDAFVGSGDAEFEKLQALMDEFTSSEFAVVAVQGENQIDAETERLISDISNQLKELHAVERCNSIVDIPSFIRSTVGDHLMNHPLIEGNLVSSDRRTATILCSMSTRGDSGPERKLTVQKMKEIVNRFRRDNPQYRIILAGPYVTLIDMYSYIDRDLLVFSILAFGLIVITLLIVFRRIGPVIYSGAIAASAVVCTLGAAVCLGLTVSLVSQMVVVFVVVLAVANCVHLLAARDETTAESPGLMRHSQASATIKKMLSPCTAVTLTSAAGFLTLCVSPMSPIRTIAGLMTGGLLLSLVVSLAALFVLPGNRIGRAAKVTGVSRRLVACVQWVIRRKVAVLVGFMLVAGGISLGMGRIAFDSDFVRNFRADSEVRKSYEYIEKNLTPLGSVDVVIKRRDSRPIIEQSVVQKADSFGRLVTAAFPMVKKTLTIADALTLAMPGLPESETSLNIRMELLQAWPVGKRILRNFVNDSGKAIRLNLRCREGYDVAEKLRVCQEIKHQAAETFGDQYDVEVTGLYKFYAQVVRNLLRDQYVALGLTLVAITAAIAVLIRSLRLTLIATIVNLLPIAVCLGAMGIAEIPMNMTTAMMLSVALGIVVDDTLHYLWRLRREYAACTDYEEALRRAHASVGKACLFTTIVITGGFSILTVSQFLPTAYFGGLLGFTMLVALAADVILLPALVLIVKPFGKESRVS